MQDDVTKLKIGSVEVIMDTKNMVFTEANLDKYMEEEAGWYNYFGQRLAEAEYLVGCYEMEYKKKYAEKFTSYKEGGSDKLADAKTLADAEVVDAQKALLKAEYHVHALNRHLKAWDKAHDNAQSRKRTILKEMERLTRGVWDRGFSDSEEKLKEILDGPAESAKE